MELTQIQQKTIKSQARYKVLNWGRRSGKTTVFAYEALGTALSINNAKVTYYAQTFGDARDIAWDIFLDVFGDSVIKKNGTLLEITVANTLGGTSKVSLKGWESVVTANKGRGTENDLLLIDEVAFCRGFHEYWTKVLDPTLLTTKGRAVFGSTPNGFNHFYDLVERATVNKDWEYIHATSYDNPFNDQEWLESKKKEITEDSFAQEYMADFRKMEGLVYKEFNRARNVFDNEVEGLEYIAGVDFGFTNPAAVIHIRKDRMDNYWVTDEFYEKGKTDQQLAEYVSIQGFNKVYPDPENPAGIQELKNKHIYCVDVVKGKGSVKNGIDQIRTMLNQNRLKIHKNCINLIWEFENYHYPNKRDNRNEEENPTKENDHALDALRYAIMSNRPHEIKRSRTFPIHKKSQINRAD